MLKVWYIRHRFSEIDLAIPLLLKVWTTEATNANLWYIHTFNKQINQIAYTFENFIFWLTKVSKHVNIIEKVISKVTNTGGFLKVTCWKCDTFVTDFQKFKNVLSNTITFEGLESWGKKIWRRRSLPFLAYLTTNTSGSYKLHWHMKVSTSLQAYKNFRD